MSRRGLQKGKTTDSIYYGNSPGKTSSISPKKPGKEGEIKPTTVMQGIKRLGEVRYANPRQGIKYNGNFNNNNFNKYADANSSS